LSPAPQIWRISWWKEFLSQELRLCATIFCIHLVVALGFKFALGIDIEAEPSKTWDWFWQTIPADLLERDMFASLAWFHAQPPFYNLFGGLFIKAFHPHHLQALQYAHILLGALLSAMLASVAFRLTRSATVAFFLAAALALHPSLFLYEAYPLYTLLVAFLVVSSVFFLSMHMGTKRPRHLIGFIVAVNLIVLTRSLYHLVFLVPAVLIVCALAGADWKRILAISLAICSLSAGWYAKNQIQFGFFGSSSWAGLGLWKIAKSRYSPRQLAKLTQKEVVDAVAVDHHPFSRPSIFRQYGFNQTSDIEVMSRNDFNNVNVIQISEFYFQNATRLILHDPLHYIRNVYEGYLWFSSPSAAFKHLKVNADKLGWFEDVVSEIVLGRYLFRLTGNENGSLVFFLLPIALIAYLVVLIRRLGFSASSWTDYLRRDAPMLFAAWVVGYTAAVGSSFEIHENHRFQFMCEHMIWLFVVVIGYRLGVRGTWRLDRVGDHPVH
jgi:hypothetical protein